MKVWLFIVGVCAFTLTFVGGCGKPTHDSDMKEMISKMNDITAVLHGAIDESSAKSAADKLKDMVTDMNKLEAQDQALPKTTPDEDKALQDKYGKDMQTAQENLAGEMARIEMNPTLAAPIDDAMKGFQPQGQ